MKLIVFSDSHRTLEHMQAVIELEQPDQVFHLGDHDADAALLRRQFPTLPVAMVQGNCDSGSDSPFTLTPVLEGIRFFLCHGHRYHVKQGISTAVYAAMEAQAQVLLYGHTHIAHQDTVNGIHILNPGACGICHQPSYGFFILEKGQLLDRGIRTL